MNILLICLINKMEIIISKICVVVKKYFNAWFIVAILVDKLILPILVDKGKQATRPYLLKAKTHRKGGVDGVV